MKKRRDILLWIGFGYLGLLVLFALFGPMVRSAQLGGALNDKLDAVYESVTQPHTPAGTKVAAVDKLRLRSDARGVVVTGSEPGTSGYAAGLKSGGVISEVDGVSIVGKPFDEALRQLSKTATARVAYSRMSGGSEEKRTVEWVREATPQDIQVGSLPLGADEQGRDILARLAQGARISLMVGLLVQAIALGLGILVGVLGVFAPRWVSIPLMRLTDGMFAFPDILLAILIIGVMQNAGILPVVVALSITSWPSLARLVKTQFATLKDREFVVAARATGASTFYLVTRHILPQLWGILLAVSMIEIAGTILAESTLSFLGIGVQAPDPSWGSMINNARSDMNSHPVLLIWPCVILSLTIFALNFVGDGLRGWLDPKGK